MKQHTKAVHTAAGTHVTVDEMEEMAFQEHQLMKVDRKAGVYRYTDNGGVHYVAPMESAAKVEQDAAFSTYFYPPKRGDMVKPEWPRGCGQRRSVSQLDCTRHVGDYHLATGTDEVFEVWAR